MDETVKLPFLKSVMSILINTKYYKINLYLLGLEMP